jgi:hypothetical protein
MLQVYVPDLFSDVRCKYVYLNVAYVSHMFQVFLFGCCVRCNDFASVLEKRLKCFIRLLL